MLLLGLDTPTLTFSAALVERSDNGDCLLGSIQEPPPTPHSDLLPNSIEQLLRSAGATIKDLTAVVVGLGPGSFTGLRISLATAKGLCYAAQIPLIGESSLKAMAVGALSQCPSGHLLVPCLDARKGEVYAGFYRATPGLTEERLEEVKPEIAISPVHLLEHLREYNACIFGIGREAYPILRELPPTSVDIHTPNAAALIRLIQNVPEYVPQMVFSLEPHYVRPSDAEWKAKPARQSGN
jgi:tRNA threonylcarbamoyladenosine biosynthesis protein TsaB